MKLLDPIRKHLSCDYCKYQEKESGHYCLLHSKIVKNMDIVTCPQWEEQA